MSVFLASLLFVTLAEMGDKTQLLAMAFATRFPASTVLAAVFVATLLNHGLAVGAGRLLTAVIPLEVISLVAAVSFLLFGLWTIRGDTLEGEDQRRSAFGPFLTVAIAFFIAELGDKTQLTTISLAVQYASPLAVLVGTTAGMVVADSFGILLAIVLGKRLPDAMIRRVSAGVFIGFGLLGAGAALPAWLPGAGTAVVLFVLAAATLGAAHALLLQRRRVEAHPEAGRLLLPRSAAQALFVALLVFGWVASLGVVAPLAGVDHWIAFALLAGLGWKLIHEAVRSRSVTRSADALRVTPALLLATLTGIHVVAAGVSPALIVVPLSIVIAAVLVVIGAPAGARRFRSEPLQRVSQHRLAIGSGLLLIGVAVQVLIEHLA